MAVSPVLKLEHGVTQQKVNQIFLASFHHSDGSLRVTIHVENIPTTPCSTLWGQPSVHRKLAGQLLIESETTLRRGEISFSETMTCGSKSHPIGLISEFAIGTTIDFYQISPSFQRTWLVGHQSLGSHVIPHFPSYPVIFPRKVDKFPFIYKTPIIELTARYM